MKCPKCHKETLSDASFCPYCGEALAQRDVSQYKYSAFISYRHVPRDQEIARRIQKTIESYKLPRGIKMQGRIDGKLGKCFRDEDELAASDSLPDRILDALRSSSALIVICSPDAQESIWVERETKAFIEMHGRERVFTVLADGNSSDSIPDYLRKKSIAGSGDEASSANPLSADLRPEASKKAADEILRIIAGVAGCGFDDLRQRERVRRRKRNAVIAFASTLAIVLVVAMSALAIQSNRDAQMNESYKLVEESKSLFAQGDRYGAIEKALAGLPESNSPFARPYIEEARQALVDALEIDPIDNLYWRPSYSIELENDVHRFIVAPDHNWFAILDTSMTLTTFDCNTGKQLGSFPLLDLCEDESLREVDSLPMAWKAVPAGDRIIVQEFAGSNIFAYFNVLSGNMEWGYHMPANGVIASPDGNLIYSSAASKKALAGTLRDAETGDLLALTSIVTDRDFDLKLIFLPEDANDQKKLFAGVGKNVVSIDFNEENPTPVISDAENLDIYSIRQIDGTIVTSSTSEYADGEKPTGSNSYEYCFKGLDQEMNVLWSHSGSWQPQLEGKGRDIFSFDSGPLVLGTAHLGRAYALCTIGDELLLFDASSGDQSYTQRFGSGIATAESVSLFTDEHDDTICLACANGTVNLLSPFSEGRDDIPWLGFSFPGYIRDAHIGWTGENDLLAFAVSLDDPRRIYCYHLDIRSFLADDKKTKKGLDGPIRGGSRQLLDTLYKQADKPASSYSLDELIEKAHKMLAEGGRE